MDCESLYKGIDEKCTEFTSLDDNGKFIHMLNAGVDIAELVAKLFMITCLSLAYNVCGISLYITLYYLKHSKLVNVLSVNATYNGRYLSTMELCQYVKTMLNL